MNNSFSFKRFFRYCASHLRCNMRLYIISAIANILYTLLIYYTNSQTIPNVGSSIHAGYFITIIILASISFNEFHKRKVSSRAFILPASKLEKFLHISILNIVVLPCLLSYIYGPMVSQTVFTYEAKDVNESLVIATGAESEAALLETINPQTGTGSYALCKESEMQILGIMQFCSYLLMCSVFFRRRQLLWGFVALALFVLIVGQILEWTAPYGYDFLTSLSKGNRLSYVSVAFTLLFTAISWLKFKRLQISK